MRKILIVLLLTSLYACSSLNLTKNMDYVLINDEFKQANITLAFGDKGFIYGHSGVNRYNAPYKISKNKIEINHAASTLMAGEEYLMKLEFKYLGLLKESNKIENNKDMIIITTKDGYKLKFKKI